MKKIQSIPYPGSLGEGSDTYVLKMIFEDNYVLLFYHFGNKFILVYQGLHLLGAIGGGDV